MKHLWKQSVSLLLCLVMILISTVGCAKTPAGGQESSATVSGESSVSGGTENPDDPENPNDPENSDSSSNPGDSSDPENPENPENPGTSGNSSGGNGSSSSSGSSNGKETTVKVGNLTVHSAQTPYVSGGKMSITVLMPYPKDSADMSKQAFTSYYEEMSGIKVTYNHYIGSDIFVLTQTMMSSGNLPDIFISVPVGFTCAKVAQYGQEGYFADLTGKLQTWAPNVYKQLQSSTHPYAKSVAYAPGKVYSLPSIFPSESEGGSVSLLEECQPMINTAWLDELGLDIPTTTDEFYKVAKAFTDEDPDGNGKDDTYGFGIKLFTPQIWNPWGLAMSWYYTGSVTEKGEVLSGLLTDQFREGCRFYNRMWKEGIFNKQMVGSDGATLKSAIHKTGIVAMSYISSYLSDSELKDWTAIRWPKGSNTGNFLAGISQPSLLDSYENMIFVSAKTKSVEACLRWIDYFYTPDGSMLWNYGPVGTAYTKVGNNYKLKSNVGTLAANQNVLCSYSPMATANILTRNSSELTTREKFGVRIRKEANEVNVCGKYNFSKLVQLATVSEKTQIDKLTAPGDVQWGYKAIRGEVNVETDWNSYVSANSKDYAAWKKIYQGIFNKHFK